MRLTAYGVDYDSVAPTYDASPYRRKEPDAALIEFLARRVGEVLRILDIGCGTGNQLVADLSIDGLASRARLVGLDRSEGMLRVARTKSRVVDWVRGDGSCVPFAEGSFDFVTIQFSHHHMAAPEVMLREAFRILRPGGRFVLTNIAPRDMADGQLYRWFPDAYEADLRAHPAAETLRSQAIDAGFVNVETRIDRRMWETDLASLAMSLSRKKDDSRLNALPDAVFERCLAALRNEASLGERTMVQDVVALLTFRADHP